MPAAAAGFAETAARFLAQHAIFVLVIAYTAAAAGSLLYLGAELRYVDETDYLSIAQNLIAHGFFSADGHLPTAFRAPGYPFLVASAWWIWPSVYAVKAMNLIAWAATGLLLAALTERFYGPFAGRLGALAFLLYLPALYSAATLYPQTIIGLVFVSLLLVLTSAPRLGRWGILAYATLGTLGTLILPNFAIIVVVMGGGAVLEGRASWRGIAAAMAALVVACLLWSLRNWLVLGDFTFATNLGLNLLLGNSDNATANSGTLANIDQITPSNEDRMVVAKVFAISA
jgi:hypothetical protein